MVSVRSLGLSGISGYEVTVECFLSGGLPAFDVVGLPDTAVREARERVRAAVKTCGARFPVSRITVNLAPANQRKEGTVYDLPILLGLLTASEELPPLPEDAAAPGGADPQAEAERREWAARLWDAVEGLDEPDRTLFLRYYYCGDKLKDIARALGLTQTAAKQRLFRGRKALRDTLTKGGVEA